MIDDDFESVFRKMFESIMGSLGDFPEGSTPFSFFPGSMFSNPENGNVSPQEKEPDFERIDLEDEVLFLVNMECEDCEFSVRVDRRTMTIVYSTEKKTIRVDLDFDVDIENSSASTRNGVMEISLKIATKESSRRREGLLRIK